MPKGIGMLESAGYGLGKPLSKQQLRKLSEQMGDVEFEMEVAAKTPTFARPYVSADRATFHPWNVGSPGYSLNGSYFPAPLDSDLTGPYEGVFNEESGVQIEPDTVYAYGARNANPQLWAHEFTHRAYEKTGKKQVWMTEEEAVRQRMAYMAQTPEEWKRAVELWKGYRESEHNEEMTYEEADRRMRGNLGNWRSSDVKARQEQGNRPKERWGPNSHFRDVYTELRERQKKTRGLGK